MINKCFVFIHQIVRFFQNQNIAIVPELQETLVNQMKTSCFCIATDGSNHQGLKKKWTLLQ